MSAGRPQTLVGRLARAGFVDPARAAELVGLLDVADDADLLEALAGVADPDLALLALVRIQDAVGRTDVHRSEGGPDPTAAIRADGGRHPDLTTLFHDLIGTAGPGRDRLLAVLGASVALGDSVVVHPELLALFRDGADLRDGADDALAAQESDLRAELLAAVGADPTAEVPVATVRGRAGVEAMRRAYRRRLIHVAAADLTAPDPLGEVARVGAVLADLAAAALEAALALARADLPDHGAGVRLAVIGLGKCGGRELNYVSDVDVVYVAEPATGTSEEQSLAVAAQLAGGIARACSTPNREPVLWPVDTALRPEGKNGPLVRTLSSHVAYYERWAETWEFQALLKARPVAGDRALGEEYLRRLRPMVWTAVERENFVADAQAMRRRVEQHVPPREVDRQLKLGPGGMRDVEFTVQLLQLVHGRADESLRSPTTLDALAALSAGGYVGRDHAARLAECYRLLRVLEHRIQLRRMRRTHLMPTDPADLRRLARAVGLPGADELLETWRRARLDVRGLHEELFYRPLLPATARLSADEARLAPEAAQARLSAIGYLDPAGAMRHIAALTEGVSRRAAIQRQLLPVMIGWFAEGPDPDGGLLAFRRLSDELGSTHWYLKLLRDSRVAAARLARVLSCSEYLAASLTRSPESVAWLADDAQLVTGDAEQLAREAEALMGRAPSPEAAFLQLRALRRRELTRAGAAEVLGVRGPADAARSITEVTDVVLAAALRVAEREAAAEHGVDELPTRLLVVALGRLGGREMGYASDADVMFVHDPVPGADPTLAQEVATTVANRLRAGLSGAAPEPPLEVDVDLRPEGRSGPLVRSLGAYREYYARWSSPWEAQALLRARPVAGDPAIAEQFTGLVDPLRYPDGGLDPAVVREIRRIKARVESERLPRGADPARHVKLGRGGLADVEWTVQLLQLQHAGQHPRLRTTSTLEALDAAQAVGLLDAADADTLRTAWILATRLRNAVVLWTGRVSGTAGDVLPHDRRDLAGLAAIMGEASGSELEQQFLRAARRARAVVERVFYG